MKHYMLPRSPMLRETHPSLELLASPNPSSQKRRSDRKQRGFPKENSDPNALPPDSFTFASPFAAGKPSTGVAATGKMRTPLPPRPPPASGNPLKRKLNLDAEVGAPCSSDSEVKVIVRMRPLRKDEENADVIAQKVANDSLAINGKTFRFDSVADAEATQVDIYQLVGAPLVENCLAGFNSSVFAYGQTGSGKTYTMWGPANALLAGHPLNDHQGLTPRVLERLFARIDEEQLKHSDKQLKYQCRCSFLEIYNEQITDLFEPSQRSLQIREDVKSGVYVENLTEECVSSVEDVMHLLLKGLSNRRTGSTSINAESSRSHSVFTCVVESRCKIASDGLSSRKISRINLVDLAGSERQKLTGAAGERLKEAGNINRSLSQLGNLINILAEVSQTGKQRHIPYRDSKLTFLLQESLGGNAKMAMICAISPVLSCKSETFSTLRFAQRAKAIRNKAVVNEVMHDDVNFLRDVIRQLKEELLLMKTHRGQGNPNGAYLSGWNARRSLNLLKFSLNRPTALANVDDDGDEVMEIDEEAVEKLCLEAALDLGTASNSNNNDASKLLHSKSASKLADSEMQKSQCGSESKCLKNQASDVSDVTMEEEIVETDARKESFVDKMDISNSSLLDRTLSTEKVVIQSVNCKRSLQELEAPTSSANGSIESGSSHNLSLNPSKSCPVVQSPPPSISPKVSSSGRKSLRTSSMLTASHKDLRSENDFIQENACTPSANTAERSSSKSPTLSNNRNRLSTTENLAASLHQGLEIIDNHLQNSPLRRSPFRFSLKPGDLKQILPVEKADVGVQTLPEDGELSDEDRNIYICSNCKNTSFPLNQETDDKSNLQMVRIDGSVSTENSMESTENSMVHVPKAVEKVLAGAIRREMALEEFCSQQTSEIMQLRRLVQQYKHERECNMIIGQIREDKIFRLENLMDGILPTEDFIQEEVMYLKKEYELLKERYDNHPEVLSTLLELKSAQAELERYKNFFDLGERDVLIEEIQDLRSQLQFYADTPRKLGRSSTLKLTYPSEPCPCPPLSSIPESTEVNVEEKDEQEGIHWSELESKWLFLTDELRAELETSRCSNETLKKELESEKKCSEELKDALQLAMEGHARMLEQYAELEEKHMQMLARHRSMQEGVEDIKKAAARAGVKGAESRFINALAREISALKMEREKETRYLRDENKALQSQLRDTAEAVQAASELLVRLREAEEAVSAAQNRAAKAEEEAERARKQMDKLKRKHEEESCSLNQTTDEARSPKQALGDSYRDLKMPKYDSLERLSTDDHGRREAFDDGGCAEDVSKLGDPSSWFSGYDRCNI